MGEMLSFYKEAILRRFMAAPDVHGVFFDEVGQFVQGCCGNHPFCDKEDSTQWCPGGPYRFSDARKAELRHCWMDAMEEIVKFVTSQGKFPIPSTNAYVS